MSSKLLELASMALGRKPGQLVIQYSDRCNATCPQCGLRVTEKFPRTTIPQDEMKRIIDHAAAQGIQFLSFTGGEPFMHTDNLVELINYANAAGIEYVRTGTNGFMFMNHNKPGWEKKIHTLASKLADTGLYTFWWSIDSADTAVHERMRGLPGVITGMEKALKIFREYDIYPSANLGINRNTGGDWNELMPDYTPDMHERLADYCRDAFAGFYRRVIDMGFTIANACYPMSIQTSGDDTTGLVYGASSADYVVSFTHEEKGVLFKALLDVIPEYCGELRIFSPLTSLHALTMKYGHGETIGYPCLGGIDYFYIDASTADTFPCGFRSKDNLGPFTNIDRAALATEPYCRSCDWECFRDPSELAGPFNDLLKNPLGLLSKACTDGTFYKYWLRDIRYYRACGYFLCRRQPNYAALHKYASNESSAHKI